MEQEVNKFSTLSKIYSQFTEINKEKLVKTAKTLLKVQKEDTEMLADAPIPQKESKKG